MKKICMALIVLFGVMTTINLVAMSQENYKILIFENVHDVYSTTVHNKQMKALGCIFLLLTPVSWPHVVTVLQFKQEPILNDSPVMQFVKSHTKYRVVKKCEQDSLICAARASYGEILPVVGKQLQKTQKYDCPEELQKRNHKKNLRKK